MSVPSMVHRSGDTLVVRSVVSGDALFTEDQEYGDELLDCVDEKDLPECKIKRNYSCASCDYFTQNPRHYLYHLRDVHNEKVKIYECPNCLYASKHYQKLLRHSKMVHGSAEGVETESSRRAKKRPAEEPEAEEDSDVAADEDDEASEADKSTVLKCPLCTFTARSEQQLAKHSSQEHMKTKYFRCTKCTYVTHMKARFTKHVKYHSMPMIKCEMCDFRTPYKWNLDRHCKNHNGKGAFRCSACNFTADIKQSLTVHEMNHHVPPVGQAAGLGVGRRRNKVGASDSTAAEEAAAAQVSRAEPEPTSASDDDSKKAATQKLKIPAKKSKVANSSQDHSSFGSDFIHPDDFIHHANGKVYIKKQCKLCNFKSPWDGEMARHESKVHNIVKNTIKSKKPARPVPNLIPIPTQASSVLKVPIRPLQKPLDIPEEPVMSQKDINDICAKSANSALKDFASLFGSEDVFKTEEPAKIPDLIPTNAYTSTPKATKDFKQKNASFFDKLKEKLMTETSCNNLTCQYCGHESKCLTELASHQKACGKETIPTHNLIPIHNLSSTRCQYCRQRCKSSADLFNHLLKCPEAVRSTQIKTEEPSPEIIELKDEPMEETKQEPHPMENRVFVWNNIEVPMDLKIDDSQYEYVEDKQEEPSLSFDVTMRTQSPCSENSYIGTEVVHHPPPTDKIPTHGNDISIAQHKRVFKCPHCSFWASTASRFHVHIVGHLNKKPFECSLCSYRSNWRWDITKHIKLKSVRDPAHESAKVLMTDETGRRNYTKYNKYLTEIHVSGEQSSDTSGGHGTRPKNYENREHISPSQLMPSKAELPKLTRAPSSSDFSPLLRGSPIRPPPPLKAADGAFFAKLTDKKKGADSKKTLWKCKKCNFRDASHDKLLLHVKGHYPQGTGAPQSDSQGETSWGRTPERDEASVGGAMLQGHAPFRCGHCQQVSNWKHVIQRHCRLKHGGDIRVVIGTKNGSEKVEIDEQVDEPDHIDVPQLGTFKCNKCPFSTDIHEDFEIHLTNHSSKPDSVLKCHFCFYFVSQKEDMYDHLKLHGIIDPEDFLAKLIDKEGEGGKRYRCLICPYITNSKSQFMYHKQFHKPRGGQYTCSYCSYNVSKRHLLHQHLKVHGVNASQKQNGEVIDLDEISDEIEEVPGDTQNIADIPLVWVAKDGKFSKMFKCRYCPHVNLRKVNIQEHEKMHRVREKSSGKGSDTEHHCSECSYVCNNAGVLSSHSKVHQGLYGTVHCLVDPSMSDEEQINELSRFVETPDAITVDEEAENTDTSAENVEECSDDPPDNILYFCEHCPARFLKKNEFEIHLRFHGVRLFYKCDYCTYAARQRPHLLAHAKVHSESYQERTKELQNIYPTHPSHPPPEVRITDTQNGEHIWNVQVPMEVESYMSKPKSCNVPLSGTELFQQKSEAQQKQAAEKIVIRPNEDFPVEKNADPQFGTLMHGNPNFIYPTYLKNGRMKEKRYKCHKCPSAFEKREQYKTHLGLHGAKQRYNCDHCDYSVKYYANYVQHLKKHQMNANAHANQPKEEDEVDSEENEVGTSESPTKNGPLKLSNAEKQTLAMLQLKKENSPSSAKDLTPEERKLYWCPSCPYMNHRKDALDNHQKRHVSVSGITNNYTCEHCDYSVPQAHFLREHSKLHFQPNKMHQPEGFLICENMKLVSKKLTEEGEDLKTDENVVFEDNSTNVLGERFLPPLNEGASERFNNNEGEKQFVNPETGEMVDKNKKKVGESSTKNEVDEN